MQSFLDMRSVNFHPHDVWKLDFIPLLLQELKTCFKIIFFSLNDVTHFHLYNDSHSLLGMVCFRAQLLQPGVSAWGLTSQKISVPRESCVLRGSS